MQVRDYSRSKRDVTYLYARLDAAILSPNQKSCGWRKLVRDDIVLVAKPYFQIQGRFTQVDRHVLFIKDISVQRHEALRQLHTKHSADLEYYCTRGGVRQSKCPVKVFPHEALNHCFHWPRFSPCSQPPSSDDNCFELAAIMQPSAKLAVVVSLIGWVTVKDGGIPSCRVETAQP